MRAMPVRSLVWFSICFLSLFLPAQAADPAGCIKDAKGETAVGDCTAAIGSGKLQGWDLAAAYVYRAVALQELDKLDEASADFQKAKALRNPYPEAMMAEAKLKWKLKARATAAKALAADPKDCLPDAEAEVAVSACTSAIEKGNLKGTDLAEAFLRRASGYDYLGTYDKAQADFDQAVVTDPTFARGFMYRGYFETLMHHDDVALDDFNKAVSLKPDGAEPLFYRARFYHEAHGDWKSVVADIEKAVQLEPDNQTYSTYLETAQSELKKQ